MFKFLMTAGVRLVKSHFRSGHGAGTSQLRLPYLICQQLENRINPVTVTNNKDLDAFNNAEPGSLRDAIEQINDSKTGGSIDFSSSAFFSGANAIDLDTDLPLITENITFTGFTDNEYVKVDGQDMFEAFQTDSGVTIEVTGLTVRNSPNGINFLDGNQTLTNLDLYSSHTDGSGGAIRMAAGTVNLHDVTFTNCDADFDGGAIYVGVGGVTLQGEVTFTGCHADDNGGAIRVDDGGIAATEGVFTFTSCTADDDGGAISLGDEILNSCDLADATFTSCTADNGGAIAITTGVITLLDTDLNFNTATVGSGGAISVGDGALIMTGGSLGANTAAIDGGAIAGDTATAR